MLSGPLETLLAADRQPPEAPLFRFVDGGFLRQLVVDKLRSYLSLAGRDTSGYAGRRLRQSAALDAHDLRFTRDAIMAMGRWSSDSFNGYYNYGRPRQLKLIQ